MLNDKQKKFCEEYMLDYNATQAAIRALYSEKTARQTGYEILTKPYIKAYIAELQNKMSELSGITTLGNILKLKEIAQSSIDSKNVKVIEQIKATEVLNKMLGLNAPDALDINDSRDITIKVVHERVNDKTEGTTPSPGTDSK